MPPAHPLFPPLDSSHEPIVVLDTETTGFPATMRGGSPDSVAIEIGAVALAPDGTLIDTFEVLIAPSQMPDGGLWPPLLAAGLTEELLREHGISAAHALQDLREWWPRHQGRAWPWVAFNSPFDAAILSQTFPGQPLPALAGCIMRACQAPMGKEGLLPRWRSGEFKWPHAVEAMTWLGIERPHIHRALPDAIDEALIVRGLWQRGLPGWVR